MTSILGVISSSGPVRPNAPTIGTATAGNNTASVTFTAPTFTGRSAISSYTVTSSPGGLTGTGAGSPIVVSGLSNGTAYTFTVTATNAKGLTSVASAASNSVTPVQPSFVAAAHPISPFITAWDWSSGFGSKYANPGTLPASAGRSTSFRLTGVDVAIGFAAGPYLTVYPFSSGFGTKYANPSPAPTIGYGVPFRPQGDAIVAAHSISPFVTAWPWSSGFGTKYANPATLPAGNARSAAFDALGDNIVIGHYTSPRITAYPWSSGFGTKYADPGTLPAGTVSRGVAFV